MHMKITKYAHACVVIEEGGFKLIIDPGEMAPDYGGQSNVAAVVITHEHFDHFSQSSTKAILAGSPGAKIYSTAEVANKLAASQANIVKAGQSIAAGPFNLEFFGQKHAVIHPDFPVCDNFGVLVNNRIYYGGDNFPLPGKPVELLLVPVSGPWLK